MPTDLSARYRRNRLVIHLLAAMVAWVTVNVATNTPLTNQQAPAGSVGGMVAATLDSLAYQYTTPGALAAGIILLPVLLQLTRWVAYAE